MEPDVKNILEKEGIQNFKKDIFLMNRRELRKYFSFKTKKRKINSTKLIKNLIWQTYTWIQDGRMEPIEGNLRSFWYVRVKPVLSRLGFNVVTGRRYTEKVYECATLAISYRANGRCGKSMPEHPTLRR